ncbi:hypothetical protein MGE_05765 [Candida albicans P75010]|nr:hypothetical protein MGE_05765 [Candida albicans P75010]
MLLALDIYKLFYWPGTEIDIVSGLAACHDNLTMGVFPRPVTTNQKNKANKEEEDEDEKIIEQTNEQQKKWEKNLCILSSTRSRIFIIPDFFLFKSVVFHI